VRINVRRVDWQFASAFRIAYETRSFAETVLVELCDGALCGRGEALGVSYQGETAASVLAQLMEMKDSIAKGISRDQLQDLLPPGGARNAIDCAMWDLEAKSTARRAWDIAGIVAVKPLLTAYTLSLDTPQEMGKAAATMKRYSLLKLKLGGEGDDERVREVRRARPDADIIVDANQSWNEGQLHQFMPQLFELGVLLIEQPLPKDNDGALVGFKSPIPLCADESCQSTDSLRSLQGKYTYVNIKLDKTGGLTEALRLARAARKLDFELMVGCMAGSSLSMAPAFIVGQMCKFVDLDGPLLSAADVTDPITYEGSVMFPPSDKLWG
jgi:L-Ala-D/L-Glu epimerase